MKNTLLKLNPLNHVRYVEALKEYYDTFPNGQQLYNKKSRTQRYPFPNYVVFIYETKTQIVIEVEE